MKDVDPVLLTPYARKYVWWQTPAEAVARPQQVIAQVMNIGDIGDLLDLNRRLGDEVLRQVLRGAEPGQFSARSWAFWHCRLGLAAPDRIPALPMRQVR